MYRVRSTDVWFNLPGVVAAYQPVACPGGPLLARVNVASDQRTPGRHMATPGTAPAWSPVTGWGFNGSTQYLNTGISPSALTWSYLIRYSNLTNTGILCGAVGFVPSYWEIGIQPSAIYFMNGTYQLSAPGLNAGVLGISDRTGYRNGVAEATIGALSLASSQAIYIGARHNGGISDKYVAANIQAMAIYRVPIGPWMRQASQQMAWCHLNPDWSAWGCRRRYYYAPSAAGFQAAWAARANRLLGGGADRV